MILELETARALGRAGQGALARLSGVLSAYGLPVSMHDPRLRDAIARMPSLVRGWAPPTPERLLDVMRVDKKVRLGVGLKMCGVYSSGVIA